MSETPDDEHTASDGQAPEGSQPPAASEPEPVYGVPDDDEAGLAQGLMVSWAEDLAIADVMAAAIRSALHASGHELAAWGEPGGDDVPAMTSPAPGDAGDGSAAPGAGEVAQADQDLDPLGDSELAASCSDQGTVMPLRDLGGHTRLAPGPNLAGSLAGTRPARLDDAALVTSVTGWRKLTSWAQARELEAVAELARRRGVLANHEAGSPAEVDAEFTPDEIAAALTLTQASASFWMDLAITLAGRLPSTLAALRAGRIDLARARLIETYTSVLDDTLATQVEKRVLAKAEGQTTGQLRAALNSAVLAADPKAAERRRRRAEKNARVELTGEPEGTASLGGRFLPPAAATVAWSHVNDLAEALHEAGVPGGIDQLRAKVFLTLLAGCEPPSPPPGGDRDNNDTPGGDGAGGSHTNKGPNADPDAGDVQDNPGDISREEDPDKGDAKEGGPDEEDATEEDPAAEDPARQDPAEEDPAEDGATHEDPEAEDPAEEDPAEEEPAEEEPEEEDLTGRGRPGAARRDRRPVLTVPWRTLAGMCGLPGQLSRLGPIDAAAALALAGAAAADVTCRWSVLVIGTEGQFLTRIPLRARARPPSKHGLPNRQRAGPLARVILTIPVTLLEGGATPGMLPGPGRDLTDRLRAAAAAAAKAASAGGTESPAGECTHPDAVPQYRIPGRIRAFVEARDRHCGYPPCRQAAERSDLDHVIPYGENGKTCKCNICAECRRHHRMKTHANWEVTQLRPGVLRWTTPALLTHINCAPPYLA